MLLWICLLRYIYTHNLIVYPETHSGGCSVAETVWSSAVFNGPEVQFSVGFHCASAAMCTSALIRGLLCRVISRQLGTGCCHPWLPLHSQAVEHRDPLVLSPHCSACVWNGEWHRGDGHVCLNALLQVTQAGLICTFGTCPRTGRESAAQVALGGTW